MDSENIYWTAGGACATPVPQIPPQSGAESTSPRAKGRTGTVMKRVCTMLLSVLGLTLAATQVEAQAWPTKPLRAIVPYGAGSTTDIIPRLVFEQLAPQLGQGIIVENRTGAGGTIGAGFVAKADPDGHTMLVNSNAHTIAPALYPKLSYDAARDFAAVIPLGTSPSVL